MIKKLRAGTNKVRWSPLRALVLTLLTHVLSACGQTDSSDAQDKPNHPRPSAEQIAKSTHAGYATPMGQQQECLGRLVFDAPRAMQWGLMESGFSGSRFGFTDVMREGSARVDIGNTRVVVTAPADIRMLNALVREVEAEKSIAIRELRNSIETKRGAIADIEDLIAHPGRTGEIVDTSEQPRVMEGIRRDIDAAEKNIAGIESGEHPMDLGLPDSRGYDAGGVFHAFLLRDGRAFEFMNYPSDSDPEPRPTTAQRREQFIKMIQRFQTRKLYDVPKQRGICIPYGFWPDEGDTLFTAAVPMRWADQPNVSYFIKTGTVDDRNFEPALLEATSRAAAGALAARIDSGRASKPQTIGPRNVQIGALSAVQGGGGVTITTKGKTPYENYSIYTGYDGWHHSQVLPFIVVDMRSYTREQEPKLKGDPPPLQQSQERLDALLNSIRLRPTEPAMPELVAH